MAKWFKAVDFGSDPYKHWTYGTVLCYSFTILLQLLMHWRKMRFENIMGKEENASIFFFYHFVFFYLYVFYPMKHNLNVFE